MMSFAGFAKELLQLLGKLLIDHVALLDALQPTRHAAL
jgi:hypothetical protein